MRNYDEALPLARRVLEARRRALGNEHESTLLISINRVAQILGRMGENEEALQLHEGGLRLSRRKFGSEHPHTLVAIASLGISCCELGRHGEGLPLLREAVAGRRKVQGEGDPDTQDAIQDLEQYEAEAAAAAAAEEEEEETMYDRMRKRRRFR